MKTSLRNSKKCSTAKLTLTLIAALASVAASAQNIASPSQAKLVQDMIANRGPKFEATLLQWSAAYGKSAVQPLLAIARDTRNSDRNRYMAIMGAARLGGASTSAPLIPLLKDKTWMIRSATLRALAALGDQKAGPEMLKLLKDPALVVRAEAVEAIKTLKPAGSAQALLAVLKSQDNYRFGKAQWVPQRALAALVVLNDRSVVRELRPLLDHQKDPELQRQTVFALSTLTGIDNDPTLSLNAQISSWKQTLASDRLPITTSAAHPVASPQTASATRSR